MSSHNRVVPFGILINPFKLVLNILASLILASVMFGNGSAIANTEPTQITLSIDATFAPTFADLINQAESLAKMEISRRFQADPTIRELQITVLGERNGQIVSLLSSQISRNEWQASSNLQQWTQYFLTSSTLLGYGNSAPISTQEPVNISRESSVERISSEALEESRVSGGISEEDYWQLVDEMD